MFVQHEIGIDDVWIADPDVVVEPLDQLDPGLGAYSWLRRAVIVNTLPRRCLGQPPIGVAGAVSDQIGIGTRLGQHALDRMIILSRHGGEAEGPERVTPRRATGEGRAAVFNEAAASHDKPAR